MARKPKSKRYGYRSGKMCKTLGCKKPALNGFDGLCRYCAMPIELTDEEKAFIYYRQTEEAADHYNGSWPSAKINDEMKKRNSAALAKMTKGSHLFGKPAKEYHKKKEQEKNDEIENNR